MKLKIIIGLFFLSHSLFSQLDYEKFNGNKGKMRFNKAYGYTNLYDYRVNASEEDSIITRKLSSSIPEGLLTDQYVNELLSNKKDSINFKIILDSRLLVDINVDRVCLIKYSTGSNNTVSEKNIFKAIKTGGSWRELNISNSEISFLEQILLGTSVEVLFQFYNRWNDPEYPDINKMKLEVKDDEGALNIKKLAEVVTNNTAVLQKYDNN